MNAVSSSPFASYCVIDATDGMIFGTYLKSFVFISKTSAIKRAGVSHNELSKLLGIHPDHAKATIQSTTQR